MIELSKIRIINWYGFSNITVPVGAFTLIAGKNGNGKSVLLDAIKYALYGDTVFNKSTENKGSRTVLSYTRGLLDATAGSYMRPADKVANVYTHIVLEMHEKEFDRYCILGTVIETNSGNGIVTQRYVMEDKCLSEVEHTYTDGQDILIYSATELQKKYGLRMFAVTEGLKKFMQRTGLRLDDKQLGAFRRKLRSIMSYDPNAKIDQFIRESVLEEKKVDFSKLVETKNNIDRLTGTFKKIDEEIQELDNILALFEEAKRTENVLLADDIKIAYKSFLKYKDSMEENFRKMNVSEKQIKEDERKLQILDKKEELLRITLSEAENNLSQMDCAKAIQEAEEALLKTNERKKVLFDERKYLLELQNRISELINWLYEEGENVAEKKILLTLTEENYSGSQKADCVENFVQALKTYRDMIVGNITRMGDTIRENEREQSKYQQIIDDCNAKRTTFAEIPDYIALKNEINKAFQKKGIHSEARFACEYVLGLTDESWRDVIEGYLGRRRYTILVEPEYYDLADDILNASKNKYAHLFNTKLLMRKDIKPVEDSVIQFVEIKNAVAKKYFEFQLGRFHATPIDKVKKYENAMSKEGRVSVAMDSYFIRFDDIRYYYLGQETIEINRRKAIKKLELLKGKGNEYQEEIINQKSKKSYVDTELKFFKECNYDACKEYSEILVECSRRESELDALKTAQNNNMEYMQLAQRVSGLREDVEALRREMNAVRDDKSNQITIYKMSEQSHKNAEENIEQVKTMLKEYEITNNIIYARAIEEYRQFIQAGKMGTGGIQKDRARAERAYREAVDNLKKAQYAYNATRATENQLPIAKTSAAYKSRKDRIWMDDRQEIQEKLKEQTKRYESIFKNEFVLTVFGSCETARADLKKINAELSRLNFKSIYEFDVKYVKDGSDYEKIIEYARYLKERENLGTADGQTTFNTIMDYSNDKGDILEQEIKEIINRIVSSSDKEQIEHYADYRNYMNYEILVSNENVLKRAKLSRQSGFNSGAEVQIPYMLILLSALLMIYNDKNNSTRLVFIDEPFAKMDPTNIKIMLNFMKAQNLQMIFCAPDKTELLGNECEVILPVLRTKPNLMEIGIFEMHKGV